MQRRLFHYSHKEAWFRRFDEAPLDSLLWSATREKVERLFLIGDGPPREYMEQPVQDHKDFWTLERYNHRYRSGLYIGGTDEKRRVEVRHAASWFPSAADGSAQECAEAYQKLGEVIQGAFDIPLLGSPSATGAACLSRSLPIGFQDVPICLEAEDLIRNSTPQARAECWGAEWVGRNLGKDLQEFFYLDGRWFYAACCAFEMPTGAALIERVTPDYLTFQKMPKGRRGWYEVMWSAPEGWAHVGLLPFFNRDLGKWSWPLHTSEPVWVCEPELRLALESGWKVMESARCTFAQGRPLLTWSEKLKGVRAQASGLVAGGVRKILLDTIGVFYSAGVEREYWCLHYQWPGISKLLTSEQVFNAEMRGDKVYYKKWMRREGEISETYKPEWAAWVWSYCRRLLNKQLLALPIDDLLGCNLDAIYLSRLPRLPDDDGKPGRFRLKGQLNKGWGLAVPRTMAELTQLKKESEAMYAALRQG